MPVKVSTPWYLEDCSRETLPHLAAANGKLPIYVFARDVRGRIPFHCAAMTGHLDVVQYFVELCNIDIDVRDHFRQSAFHLTMSHFAVTRYLVVHRGNINARDYRQETPMYKAARLDFYNSTVVFLIEHGAEIDTLTTPNKGTTPLHWALKLDHSHIRVKPCEEEAVKWLLKHYARVGSRAEKKLEKRLPRDLYKLVIDFVTEK